MWNKLANFLQTIPSHHWGKHKINKFCILCFKLFIEKLNKFCVLNYSVLEMLQLMSASYVTLMSRYSLQWKSFSICVILIWESPPDVAKLNLCRAERVLSEHERCNPNNCSTWGYPMLHGVLLLQIEFLAPCKICWKKALYYWLNHK